mmetsp:Transcript_5481/g.6778  ORF Transcript_5481/g.6778 Transcript_5481/m.6778 type:complete len:149 (-) Transcript_5481:53-499(-)
MAKQTERYINNNNEYRIKSKNVNQNDRIFPERKADIRFDPDPNAEDYQILQAFAEFQKKANSILHKCDTALEENRDLGRGGVDLKKREAESGIVLEMLVELEHRMKALSISVALRKDNMAHFQRKVQSQIERKTTIGCNYDNLPWTGL